LNSQCGFLSFGILFSTVQAILVARYLMIKLKIDGVHPFWIIFSPFFFLVVLCGLLILLVLSFYVVNQILWPMNYDISSTSTQAIYLQRFYPSSFLFNINMELLFFWYIMYALNPISQGDYFF